jgi:hypothetical protein
MTHELRRLTGLRRSSLASLHHDRERRDIGAKTEEPATAFLADLDVQRDYGRI